VKLKKSTGGRLEDQRNRHCLREEEGMKQKGNGRRGQKDKKEGFNKRKSQAEQCTNTTGKTSRICISTATQETHGVRQDRTRAGRKAWRGGALAESPGGLLHAERRWGTAAAGGSRLRSQINLGWLESGPKGTARSECQPTMGAGEDRGKREREAKIAKGGAQAS